MRLNSIRFKTSVLFSGILLVVLMINGAEIYFKLKRTLYRDLDRELVVKSEQIANMVNAYAALHRKKTHPFSLMKGFVAGYGDDVDILKELWKSDMQTLGLQNDYYRILTLQGNVLQSSQNLDPHRAALMPRDVPSLSERIRFETIREKGLSGRMTSSVFFYEKKIPLVIQLLTSTARQDKILAEMAGFMLFSVLAIVMIASSLGRYLAGSILKPVSRVTAAANAISHTDLSVRIDEEAKDGEMQDLVRSFNQMLGRMEASFEHINEFSSHVAHELKTPLAIIRGEVELALSRDDTSLDEQRKVLDDVLEETDRLIRIIKDLLLLAKLDYRPEIFKMEPLEAGQFLRELVSQSQILASEKEIEICPDLPDKDLPIEGDFVHLRRLFLNLMNNAVSFSPPKTHIAVTARRVENRLEIAIADSGPGISEREQDKIFAKFYRGNKEASGPPGNGLGLPIALSIARAHKGDITVTSRPGHGSTFTVTLPLPS